MKARSVSCIALLFLVLPVAVASAHGDEEHYRSQVRAVHPSIAGLTIGVLERDERLRLVNDTGKPIAIPGYEGEPYLRVAVNGLVEINDHSPTRYLNEDRVAQTPVPKSATPKAKPVWRVIGHRGIVSWHDHRIHWMSSKRPPQVKDAEQVTKIFDWSVPIQVGRERAAVVGTLFWDPVDPDAAAPSGSGFPIGAVAGGVAGGLCVLAAAAFLLRRRPRPTTREKAEAW